MVMARHRRYGENQKEGWIKLGRAPEKANKYIKSQFN